MKPAFRSITARLTAGLGLIACITFVSTSALLHRGLALDLRNADLDTLAGKVGVVLHFVAESAADGAFGTLVHHLDDLRIGHEGLSISIFDADGRLVYGDARLPRANGPGHGTTSIDGRTSIDLQTTVLPKASPWPGGTLVVGLDPRRRQALLDSHLSTLIVASTAGISLTALLSWMATRRSLAVIRRISREATAITPATMGTRLSDPAQDVELSKLVEAFNAVLARLQASYGQMQAFNANVAHELRTPLATLISGTQVALSSARWRDELRDVLASNLEELERMSSLVNDMLFLARADNGRLAEGLESVCLGDEADKAIRYCEALLDESGLKAVRTGNLAIRCNPGLVHRALVNLLSNAARHTGTGGCIEVVVETDGSETRLAVLNPGPPIRPEVRERLFERFFRGDPARAEAGQRFGLGLAIVAAIARMHGARTFVERRGGCNVVGIGFPASPSTNADADDGRTRPGGLIRAGDH